LKFLSDISLSQEYYEISKVSTKKKKKHLLHLKIGSSKV